MSEPFDIEHAALLVMDMQRSVVERQSNHAEVLAALGKAITAARSVAIPVIYVVVRFRDGYPEISSRNRGFSALRQTGNGFIEGNPAAEIHPAIAPQAGDIIVTKRRVSAFAGSDLEIILRSQNIDSLVLSGIATSGVVLSTLRYAADLDYHLSVLADGCADRDAEVHRVLLEKVFPRQATVLKVTDWCTTIEKH